MSTGTKEEAQAREVNLKRASRILEIVWDDDTRSQYSFSQLRANCRCAECKSILQRNSLVQVVAPEGVAVTDIRPIGTYALQFIFDDGHERGIFPFHYLREL